MQCIATPDLVSAEGTVTIDAFAHLRAQWWSCVPSIASFPTLRAPYFRRAAEEGAQRHPADSLMALLSFQTPAPTMFRSGEHPDLNAPAWRAGAASRAAASVDLPSLLAMNESVTMRGFGAKRKRSRAAAAAAASSAGGAAPASRAAAAEWRCVPVAELRADIVFRSLVWTHAREEARIALFGQQFFVPRCSAFGIADAAHFGRALKMWASSGGGEGGVQPASSSFRTVLVDPPWKNRSAARGGGYRDDASAMKALGELQLAPWLAPGAIVGVWVTHDPATHAMARRWLGAWLGAAPLEGGGKSGAGADAGAAAAAAAPPPPPDSASGSGIGAGGVSAVKIATFTWLKVCETGELCFPLPSAEAHIDARKPYEVLLLARYRGGCSAAAAAAMATSRSLPERAVFASVPSQHSRKPPLAALLAPYIGQVRGAGGDVDHLELFARELRPFALSLGNDVLRFNDARYFG